MYTVDYFISKFEAIPERMWGTDVPSFYAVDGFPKCALGHCRVGPSGMEYEDMSPESKSLCNLFYKINPRESKPQSVWSVNDGIGVEYKQPTPKQRILAALNDIKKLQNPYPDATKQILSEIRDVDSRVDGKVKEMAKAEAAKDSIDGLI